MERGRFAKALGRQRASAAPLRFTVFGREERTEERTNQIKVSLLIKIKIRLPP